MIEEQLTPLICSRFKSDARYREGHIRIINPLPHREVMGLHIPEMKSVAKRLAAGKDVAELLHRFAEESATLTHDEVMVWGFVINAMRCDEVERISYTKEYIPVIDNWAVCDSFCSNAKWLGRMDKEVLWNFLLPYYASGREFEVRFALVTSMCYLLDWVYLPRIFEQIARLKYDEIHSEYISAKEAKNSDEKGKKRGVTIGASPYYVRMGVAWLLATALYKYPDATRAFAVSSSLPDDVRRLYVRKARESFRTRNVAAL